MHKNILLFLKKHKYILLSGFLCFSLGALVFFIKRRWLIVNWVPSYSKSFAVERSLKKDRSFRRSLSVIFWKDGNLKKESIPVVLFSDKGENLKIIIGAWLSFLNDERVLQKRLKVGSVSVCESGQEAYISFDQVILSREWSINKKWQIIDGICKTVYNFDPEIKYLNFLVRHEPMIDDHLDFTTHWSVCL